jgi:hypothetical protein
MFGFEVSTNPLIIQNLSMFLVGLLFVKFEPFRSLLEALSP